ncbi:MAG: VWA domain-containing protein [Actinobacteria bacterium]|nr:VWA domain-containing protein [Actinomycetota bacterium]
MTATTPLPAYDRTLTGEPHDRERPGCGSARTPSGALPLIGMDLDARLVGLSAACTVRQRFRNTGERPLEVTYVFPLPSRGAVTGLEAVLGGRTVEGRIMERGAARQTYEEAVVAGQRAALAEKDRPDVFTSTLGNLQPGEDAEIALELVCPLVVDEGEATFRFPMVVAPRYTTGGALDDEPAGEGEAKDTDRVPDASRVTPPRLGAQDPRPELSVRVTIDDAGLGLTGWRSSLHAVRPAGDEESLVLELEPGERMDRDLILRARLGDGPATSLVTVPDAEGDEGTWALTAVAPRGTTRTDDLDVVVVLDRSGSMTGWKMVAARRAAARLVDSLTSGDRFAVLAFDNIVEHPLDVAGLTEASDRNRFAAVRWLGQLEARGGTELGHALDEAGRRFPRDGGGRRRCVVLVTDGQVTGEDHVLRTAAGEGLGDVRLHCVGIDQAVNAGLLERMARSSGGHVELVEGEDRLDTSLASICRVVNPPLVTDLEVTLEGADLIEGTVSPPVRDLVGGVPLVVSGRYRRRGEGAPGTATLRYDGAPGLLPHELAAVASSSTAVPVLWAQSRITDLEDEYAGRRRPGAMEEVVGLSLRFGVLSRFTAFVAVDPERQSTDDLVHVVQPVEQPAGWAMAAAPMQMKAYAPSPLADAARHRSAPTGPLPAPAAPTGRAPKRRARPPGRRTTGLDEALQLVERLLQQLERGVTPDPADLRRAAVALRTARVSDEQRSAVDELTRLLDRLASGLEAGSSPSAEAVDELRAALRKVRKPKRRFWER